MDLHFYVLSQRIGDCKEKSFLRSVLDLSVHEERVNFAGRGLLARPHPEAEPQSDRRGLTHKFGGGGVFNEPFPGTCRICPSPTGATNSTTLPSQSLSYVTSLL